MAKQMAFDVEARDRLRAGGGQDRACRREHARTQGPQRHPRQELGRAGDHEGRRHRRRRDRAREPLREHGAPSSCARRRRGPTRTRATARTTATVLAKALVDEGMKLLAAGAHGDGLLRGIRLAVDVAVADVAKRARKINAGDRKQLEQIATISANGDTTIGKTLADALDKVGADGVITIEEGKGLETQVNVVEGMQFDRGFLSAHFVTNVDRLEVVFDKPLILIHQEKISAAKTLIPLLEMVSKGGRPLLIIAEDIEGEALATLVGQQAARHRQRVRREGARLRRPPQVDAAGPRHDHRRHGHRAGPGSRRREDQARTARHRAQGHRDVGVHHDRRGRRQGRGRLGPHQAHPARDRGHDQRLRQGEAPGAPGQAGRRHRGDPRRRRDRDRAQGAQGALRGQPPRHARGAGRGVLAGGGVALLRRGRPSTRSRRRSRATRSSAPASSARRSSCRCA